MKFSLLPVRFYKQLRWLAGVSILGGLALFGFHAWREGRNWVETDNAYLDSPVHPLASRLIGTVDEVLVEENSRVRQGQVLVRLDPRDTQARREQAEAKLSEMKASLVASEASVSRAMANVRLDGIILQKAELDLIRMQGLSQSGHASVARKELDDAQSAHDTALAAVSVSQSAVLVAEAGVEVAHAQVASAVATHREAVLQCEYTTITAPVTGRVGRRNVESGQPVIPAQPLFALVGDDFWLTANFKETQIARLHPGQEVLIRFDAFPGRDWPGTVESLSPASGSRFALLPPDNATGNFTRVVQRLPVRIRIDESVVRAIGERLAPGLSAKVKVRVGADVKTTTSVALPGKLTQQ